MLFLLLVDLATSLRRLAAVSGSKFLHASSVLVTISAVGRVGGGDSKIEASTEQTGFSVV